MSEWIHYDFKHECETCGNLPTVDDTRLCDPCCFGDADTLWDWVYTVLEDLSSYSKREKRLMREWIEDELEDMEDYGLELEPDLNEQLQRLYNSIGV